MSKTSWFSVGAWRGKKKKDPPPAPKCVYVLKVDVWGKTVESKGFKKLQDAERARDEMVKRCRLAKIEIVSV